VLSPHLVEEAAARLAGVAHRTPLATCSAIDTVVGARVFLKCENLQRVGAFKFRGAYNTLATLSDQQRARGVVTHSSGNHAQGVALAARLFAAPATIVMPHEAPAIKRRATEGYGARIVPCDAADRESVCDDLMAAEGLTLVHPYDDERIIGGAGTAAREMLEDVPDLDVIVAPVGGGGLSSGACLAAAGTACRVWGVEPADADDGRRSLAADRVVTLQAVPGTIADGLRTRHIGERNLDVFRRHLAGIVTVDDGEIVAAMKLLWERAKILAEPSGAVALAAVLTRRMPWPENARVGVLVSGGNVDVSASFAALAG